VKCLASRFLFSQSIPGRDFIGMYLESQVLIFRFDICEIAGFVLFLLGFYSKSYSVRTSVHPTVAWMIQQPMLPAVSSRILFQIVLRPDIRVRFLLSLLSFLRFYCRISAIVSGVFHLVTANAGCGMSGSYSATKRFACLTAIQTLCALQFILDSMRVGLLFRLSAR
jgi:hypothetical protein